MADTLTGQVVLVTETGDLVTDITADQLKGLPTDERVTILCDGHITAGIYPENHEQPEMTLLAILSGRGCLELTLVGDSASQFLGIQQGCKVTVRWQS